jgi:hypothetical protein
MATPPPTVINLSQDSADEDISIECAPPAYCVIIRLHNDTTDHHAFKCKTNAPRRWSVKPNGGVIDPGESVEVAFKLCGPSLEGLDIDRHLLLEAPVAAADVARLRTQRQQNPRSSINMPDLDTPRLRQRRLTPRFGTRPDAVTLAALSGAREIVSPSSAVLLSPGTESASSTRARNSPPMVSPEAGPPSAARPPSIESPLPSQAVHARTPGTLSGPWDGKQPTVAARVAELDRRYGGLTNLDGDSGVGQGDDASSASSGERARRRRGLLGTILSLLSRGTDEFLPWLSWKVYDILWALLLLYLGRRLKCIRRAQELEIL